MLLVLVSVSVSCQKDEQDGFGGNDYKPGSDVQIDNIVTQNLTAEEYADLIFGDNALTRTSEENVAREEFLNRENLRSEKLAAELGMNGLATGYTTCKFNYMSRDAHNRPIWLSGLVVWGGYWFFGYHDLDPDYINIVQHYTVLANSQVPSSGSCMELEFVSGDNLIIMPDLIGYGISSNRVHPYLNHDVCAINSIDALAAGYEVFRRESDDADLEDDYSTYVTGYSQGEAML